MSTTATNGEYQTVDLWKAAYLLSKGWTLLKVEPGHPGQPNKTIVLQDPPGVDREQVIQAYLRRDAQRRLDHLDTQLRQAQAQMSAALDHEAATEPQSLSSAKPLLSLVDEARQVLNVLVDPILLVTEYKRLKNEFDQVDVTERNLRHARTTVGDLSASGAR